MDPQARTVCSFSPPAFLRGKLVGHPGILLLFPCYRNAPAARQVLLREQASSSYSGEPFGADARRIPRPVPTPTSESPRTPEQILAIVGGKGLLVKPRVRRLHRPLAGKQGAVRHHVRHHTSHSITTRAHMSCCCTVRIVLLASTYRRKQCTHTHIYIYMR